MAKLELMTLKKRGPEQNISTEKSSGESTLSRQELALQKRHLQEQLVSAQEDESLASAEEVDRIRQQLDEIFEQAPQKERSKFSELPESERYESSYDTERAVDALINVEAAEDGSIILHPALDLPVRQTLEKFKSRKLETAISHNPELAGTSAEINAQLLDYVCGVDVTPFRLEDDPEGNIWFIDVYYHTAQQIEGGTNIHMTLDKKHANHRQSTSALADIYSINKDQVKTLVLVVDTPITPDMKISDIAKSALASKKDTVYLSQV